MKVLTVIAISALAVLGAAAPGAATAVPESDTDPVCITCWGFLDE